MKNPPNSSEQALEDYFDDLLSEPAAASDAVSASAAADVLIPPEELLQPMPPLRTARLAHLPLRNMATPASALAGTVAATPLRAYAEPIRTLNLRMPLPPPAVVEVSAPPVQLQPTLRTEPEPAPVVAAPEPAPIVEAPAAEQSIEEQVLETQVSETQLLETQLLETQLLETVAAEPAPWLANGRPGWAQRPFECLLFRVGGLGLVAPLAELGSIYKLEPGALTAIFGQAPWFMGLLPVKGYSIRVIDAAQVVMPERYTPELREQYRYVISLHGSDWGLAVDAVADSITLQPDDVRWRGQRGKRPWLAGTVIERMCALLDVAQLVWMFENQDGKRGAPRV